MITADITFQTPRQCRIPALLAFDPADPLVVRLTLTSGDQVAVWHLSRQLLADAMVRPSGEGDVQAHVAQGSWLVLRLSSPAGESMQRCCVTTVWEFLEITFNSCPPCRGVESAGHRYCVECATVDMALDRWLAEVEKGAAADDGGQPASFGSAA